MSSIVSWRPSSMNHLNEAFWMSIRFGRSRTSLRREKLLRARRAATLLVKKRDLPLGRVKRQRAGEMQNGGATLESSRKSGLSASSSLRKTAQRASTIAPRVQKGERGAEAPLSLPDERLSGRCLSLQ